jgi:small subunit ribosomal protein S20
LRNRRETRGFRGVKNRGQALSPSPWPKSALTLGTASSKIGHLDKENFMIRHPSAIRQHRRSVRRTAVNKRNKTSLRTQVKTLRHKIQAKDKEEAVKLLPRIFSAADRTAKKGAIHKKKAARLKSRLSRQLRSLSSSQSS